MSALKNIVQQTLNGFGTVLSAVLPGPANLLLTAFGTKQKTNDTTTATVSDSLISLGLLTKNLENGTASKNIGAGFSISGPMWIIIIALAALFIFKPFKRRKR